MFATPTSAGTEEDKTSTPPRSESPLQHSAGGDVKAIPKEKGLFKFDSSQFVFTALAEEKGRPAGIAPSLPDDLSKNIFSFLDYRTVYTIVRLVSKKWHALSTDTQVDQELTKQWKTKCRAHLEFKQGSLTRHLFAEQKLSENSIQAYLAQRYALQGFDFSIDHLVLLFEQTKAWIPGYVSQHYVADEKLVQNFFYADITGEDLRQQVTEVMIQASSLRAQGLEKDALVSFAWLEEKERKTQETALTAKRSDGCVSNCAPHLIQLHEFFEKARHVMGIIADTYMIARMADLTLDGNFVRAGSLPHAIALLKNPRWNYYITGKALMVIANWKLGLGLFHHFFIEAGLTTLLERLTAAEIVYIGRWNSTQVRGNTSGMLQQFISLTSLQAKLSSRDYHALCLFSVKNIDDTGIDSDRAVIILANPRIIPYLTDEDLLVLMKPTWDEWEKPNNSLLSNQVLMDRMAKHEGELWLKLVKKDGSSFKRVVLKTPAIYEYITNVNILAQIIMESFSEGAVAYFSKHGVAKFDGLFTLSERRGLQGDCESANRQDLVLQLRVLRTKDDTASAEIKDEKQQVRVDADTRRLPPASIMDASIPHFQPPPSLLLRPTITFPQPQPAPPRQNNRNKLRCRYLLAVSVILLLGIVSLLLIAGGISALAGAPLLFITTAAAGYMAIGGGIGGLLIDVMLRYCVKVVLFEHRLQRAQTAFFQQQQALDESHDQLPYILPSPDLVHNYSNTVVPDFARKLDFNPTATTVEAEAIADPHHVPQYFATNPR